MIFEFYEQKYVKKKVYLKLNLSKSTKQESPLKTFNG